MIRIHRTLASLLIAPLLLLLLLPLSGCGSTPSSHLRLRSMQSGKLFSQTFDKAYFAEPVPGEYEVVLIDDGTSEARDTQADAGDPLRPMRSAPLRQVVHIRVHWRPPSGTRSDHPSATNATLDWYVTPNTATPTDDRLHYRGAAFVSIYPKGRAAEVYIRNAEIEPVETSGQMTDPLGATRLTGTIVAQRDEQMVAAVAVPARIEAISRVRPAVPAGAGISNLEIRNPKEGRNRNTE